MDPTLEFFAKLKKLAVTLESETERLQQAFESRKSEDDAGEWGRSWGRRGGPSRPEAARVEPLGPVPAPQRRFLISEKSSGAMRACHQVNWDVSNLKVPSEGGEPQMSEQI